MNSLKNIPIREDSSNKTDKIILAFFIKLKALFSFLFFIAFAIIGNNATLVAIANNAKGS